VFVYLFVETAVFTAILSPIVELNLFNPPANNLLPNAHCLGQCGPTTGSRAACVPPQRFVWPAETFRKNLQIWNLFKNEWSCICLTGLLALDKVRLHKNNQ